MASYEGLKNWKEIKSIFKNIRKNLNCKSKLKVIVFDVTRSINGLFSNAMSYVHDDSTYFDQSQNTGNSAINCI